MDLLDRLRRAYGGRAEFVSLFQDGLEIPWDSLTIGEYVEYCRRASITQPEDLEDELFASHVRDEYLTSNIGGQKSGTVVRIAHDIVTQSWPQNPAELEMIINFHRAHVYPSVIEDLVIWITRAFPGYTPDQLYAKGLDDFLHLSALAEKKLQQDGIIEGPFSFTAKEEPKEAPKKGNLNPRGGRSKIKERFDKLYGEAAPQEDLEFIPAPAEYDGKDTIIGSKDQIPKGLASELTEGDALKEGVRKTAGVYSEYFAEMDENGKITPEVIKRRVQERIDSSEERLEASKREHAEIVARLRKRAIEEELEAERKFKKGLGRRGRRNLPKGK